MALQHNGLAANQFMQHDLMKSSLAQNVLVLNRSYQPINITTVKRALCMMVVGVANALDDHYQVFDFKSWSELSAKKDEMVIKTPSSLVRIPKIIIVQALYRSPIGRVRFSRQNIYARDKYTCQYCGILYKRSALNFDHVVPRTQGGSTSWENVVTSCIKCNTKKGGRTPKQANMKLLNKPKKPSWSDLGAKLHTIKIQKLWLPFLNPVDVAYWHTELEHDIP